MPALATDLKSFIEDYFHALSGNSKTDDLIDRYTSSPALKEHIQMAESGFPSYKLVPQPPPSPPPIPNRRRWTGTPSSSCARRGADGSWASASSLR